MESLIYFTSTGPLGAFVGIVLLFIGVVTVIGWAGFAWSGIVWLMQRLREGWAANAPSRPAR